MFYFLSLVDNNNNKTITCYGLWFIKFLKIHYLYYYIIVFILKKIIQTI